MIVFAFVLFLKLSQKLPEFENKEHEKAWLIRTAKNVCRDELRRHRRRDADELAIIVRGTPGPVAENMKTRPAADMPGGAENEPFV